jgi:hypothetical protein
MNIISFSVLLCLTFRNCTTLAICSYVTRIYYNYVIVTCYSYAFLDQTVLFNCFIANRLSHC